jgi:DNA-binding response OmpR family regulator
MSALARRRVAILEDSDEDFEAVRRALARPGDGGLGLIRFCTAGETLDHLGNAGRGTAEWPILLLLDLRLPTRAGLDVVGSIRGDRTLCGLPIVVLSGSGRQQDIDAAYRRGANAYIIKPLAFEDLRDALRAMQDFWAAAALPSAPVPARSIGSVLS